MLPMSDSGRGPETFPKCTKRTIYLTHKNQPDYYTYSQYYTTTLVLHNFNPKDVTGNSNDPALPDEAPVTCLGAPGCLNCWCKRTIYNILRSPSIWMHDK